LKVITFLCARTPLSAACTRWVAAGTGVADSKGGNASTGASQVKILTSQLTSRIGLLPVSAWPSHDGKEGDGGKS